jgi:ribose 5-phosphate isomerase B
MKIAVASDHAGFPYKAAVIDAIRKKGYDVLDLGCDSEASVDFPDYAEAVGRAIVRKEAKRGIILCGSGVGMSIAANKIRGIRAAVCHDTYSVQQGVEHNDMNVLALGARVVSIEKVPELVSAFLDADVLDEPRYKRRVLKIDALDDAG